MKAIYVCHPFRDMPDSNLARMQKVCQYITSQGHVPICTPLYFPQFNCEEEDAIPMCVELVRRCDELWICDNRISEGMTPEINAAYEAGLAVKHLRFGLVP